MMIKDMAIGTGSLEFDSWASAIGRSAANGSPPLQCAFGAVLPRR